MRSFPAALATQALAYGLEVQNYYRPPCYAEVFIPAQVAGCMLRGLSEDMQRFLLLFKSDEIEVEEIDDLVADHGGSSARHAAEGNALMAVCFPTGSSKLRSRHERPGQRREGFRRFLVVKDGRPIAEGVQFQDGHGATREEPGKGRRTSLWDSTHDILDNVQYCTSFLHWVDESDSDLHLVDGRFRRFVVQRDIDETGVSGTGQVVEGVQFEDGYVAFRWCANLTRSSGHFSSIEEMMDIHGHDGKTRAVWVD